MSLNPDAIAEQVRVESARDARVRQAAHHARQCRAEAREAHETAEDLAAMIAARLAIGEASESDVVAVLRTRDDARLRLEAWDLAVRALDQDPALLGRR